MLRIILIFAILGWGVSFLAVILPWSLVSEGLLSLGANEIPNDPMIKYWTNMGAGAFTLIGSLFAVILFSLKKYGIFIPVMAWLCIAEGLILMISGLSLHLPPFPFWGDTLFCLGTGAALLFVYPRYRKEIEA